MVSCNIFPLVEDNKNGGTVKSPLFLSILKLSRNKRSEAKALYNRLTSKEFLSEGSPISDSLRKLLLKKIDSGNKGTRDTVLNEYLYDIIAETGLEGVISDDTIDSYAAYEIGESSGNSEGSAVYTYESDYTTKRELLGKAVHFNDTNKLSKAYNMRLSYNEGLIGVAVQHNSKGNVSVDIKSNEALYTKLEDILNKAGIGIELLDKYEDKLTGIQADGYVSYDGAIHTADGLINAIKLVKGKEYDTLPEEFSHVIVHLLGKNSLYERLEGILTDGLIESILGEDYDTYKSLYNSDAKLKEEVIGKLVGDALVSNHYGIKSPLLNRLVEAVKGGLLNISEEELEKAIEEIYSVTDEYLNTIYAPDLVEHLKKGELQALEAMYKIARETKAPPSVIEQIRSNYEHIIKPILHKREYLANKRGRNVEKISRLKIDSVELADLEVDENGVNNLIEGMHTLIKELITENLNNFYYTQGLRNLKDATPNQKAKYLLGALDNVKAGISIVNTLSLLTKDFETFKEWYTENSRELNLEIPDDKVLLEKFGEWTTMIMDLSGIVNPTYQNILLQMKNPLLEFFDAYFDDNDAVLTNGKKDNLSSLKDLLESASKDVSFVERWLRSAANSSDPILRKVSYIVDRTKQDINNSTLEFREQIHKLALKAEKEGIKDWTFIYKRNSEGNITEDLITKGSEQHKQLNEKQQKYLDEYLKYKLELDKLLPNTNQYATKAVLIRKDFVDRIVENGVKDAAKHITDSVIANSSDLDIIAKADRLIGLDGKEVHLVPIYFRSMKEGETMQDMYIDPISNLIAYASMAINYDGMNDIVYALEGLKEVLTTRDIKTGSQESIINNGIKMVNEALKPTESSFFSAMLEDYYANNIYNVSSSGSTIDILGKRISVDKSLRTLSSLNAVQVMSLNILNGVVNVTNGLLQQIIDTAGAEFFTHRDLSWAYTKYCSNLHNVVTDQWSRYKTSKMGLLLERLDIKQDLDVELKNQRWTKEKFFRAIFSTKTLSIQQGVGEHFLHGSTALAILHNTKVKDKIGNVTNLYELFDTANVDANDASLGKKLILKEGYTDLEGNPITWDYVNKIQLKIKAVNQDLNGIYSNIDKNGLQKSMWGNLILMYRKWITSSFDRRFRKGIYDYRTDTYKEGYYRTLGIVGMDLFNSLKNSETTLASVWHNLDANQKANMRRAITELTMMVALYFLAGAFDDKKNRKKTWAEKFAEYMAYRTFTEMAFMAPTIVNPKATIDSWLKLFTSPTAVLSTIQGLFTSMGMLLDTAYSAVGGELDTIKSGRFKGKSTLYKNWYQSPLNAPGVNNIDKFLNPEDITTYLKTSK